jgi:high-affinity nickel-transport protein
MAFTLGVRHGFDLDHLATIDAMTRTVKHNARLSKYVGFLFSLGHGSIVILMSVFIGSGMIKIRSPVWLETFGSWVSIFFLLLFGFVTFWNSKSDKVTLPTGLTFFIFKKLIGDRINPFLILVIGALFAFSFDTFTQVTLLSISASMMEGLFCSILLGIVFMLGMMASDGLNGWFVSSLIQLADKKSVVLSRVMGVMIASFSVFLGLISLLKQLVNS